MFKNCFTARKTETNDEVKEKNGSLKVFQLQKNADRCTGLFYRSNPFKDDHSVLAQYNDWPRDNALLMGEVHEASQKKWLKVKKLKQPGKKKFTKCQGESVWIPFVHDQYFLVEHKDKQ